MPSIFLPTFRGLSAVVDARRCWVMACVCLLVVAIGLRFYNLSGFPVAHDEARAAIFSWGDLSEVLDNTRRENSSPILYPLALWAVQKVSSTAFSVRLMPAVASALTVGALLFLLPRLGAPRRAAFLAGLLATVSVAAIDHAHGVREYSVDALVAALMIAGLLRYLRDGRSGLLCGALFVGPLLQYGLVMFGAAALGVAAVDAAFSERQVGSGRLGHRLRVWEWLKARSGLLLPIGAFGAACVMSWALTARYQWKDGGHGGGGDYDGYLVAYYYKSGIDAAAFVEFAVDRTWGMLGYHMPTVIAAAALLAFGALLLLSAWRRRLDAVALLGLLAVGLALCAALIDAYPFGGIRQCLYLGPIVFLVAGSAFHRVGVAAAALWRREWLSTAVGVAVVTAIAVAGAVEFMQRPERIYHVDNSIKRVIAALDELEREGDVVYASKWEAITLRFYKGEGEEPDNYFYGSVYRRPSLPDYVPAMLGEMFRAFDNPRRIWLVHNRDVSVSEEMAAYSAAHSQEVAVDEVATGGWHTLHLITGFDGLAASVRGEWLDAVAGAPDAVSTYNLYLQADALYYAKRPCAPGDTDAPFFLSIYPEYAADLRDARQQYGYDIVKFDFHPALGLRVSDRCVIRLALPEYAVKHIHAGQFIEDGPVIWEADFPFDPKVWLDMYEDVVSGVPSAVADYDLYLREDALYYAKRQCDSVDVEARFFLHIYPEDAGDLPAALRQYGFQNLDFEFHDYGAVADCKRFIRRALPGYAIERIHTGQFAYPDGAVLWEAELSLGR